MLSLRLFSFICAGALLMPLVLQAQIEPSPSEQTVFAESTLRPFDGARIHSIHITGLRWTKEKAVRWLLGLREGDLFVTETWEKGLHKLYDTTVLYNAQTVIRPLSDFKDRQIDIELHLEDRWTLLPFGIAQAGGGSSNLGGGLADVNVFGYFAQLGAGYSVFNGVGSYDFNYYQEFFRDTDLILGLDISGTGAPIDLQKNDGSSLGSFTWFRSQEQLLLGRKFISQYEPKIRLFSYFEFYEDYMVTSTAPEARVYSGAQYRIRPTVIFGRSELTNFLEQGYEFTIAPTSANFFGGRREYSTLVSTYKRTFLDGNTNYAMFFNVGAMTSSPIPYLFHLGGYDTVRGFSTNRAVGRYYINNNLEYRPYLTRFSSDLTGELVFQGAVFNDIGQMWNSPDLSQTRRVESHLFLLSQGIGIRVNIMRFAGAIGRLDFARTAIPDEGWGFSLGVGQFF